MEGGRKTLIVAMIDRAKRNSSPPLPELLPRLLRVIWPFLLTIVGCVGLGLFSMELMSAGRAYVSGESLWSKGQKNAVLHLSEYAVSCDPNDYRDYVAALSVTKGDRVARLALSQPVPDKKAAREGFLLGQNHPDDIDSMIMLFLRFGEVSFFAQAISIWAQADDLIDELELAAERLRRVVNADCRDEAAKKVAMRQVLDINERLTPLQRQFSDTVGQANRIVHLLTGGALMLITAVLVSIGAMLSLRVQGRYAQAERRLADSQQRFALAVASSRQGLWDLDVDSGELFVSPEVEQILDLSRGTFGGHRHDFIKRLHPEERDGAVEQLNELIAKGQSFEMELRVMDGQGQYRWVRTAGQSQFGAQGRATRVLGSLQDISARRALEEALQQQMKSREAAIEALLRLLETGIGDSPVKAPTARDIGASQAPLVVGTVEDGRADTLQQASRLVARLVDQLKRHGEHLDAIFALSPDGFVSFDERSRINHVNAAFTRLTGLTEAAALGLSEGELERKLSALMPTGMRMPRLTDLRGMSNAESSKRKQPRIELERPAQRVIELQWREGPPGSISQVLYLRDVTYETEVDRIKSEFLSTAAHELRTPMASIIGFSELLMMRDYPPPRRNELLQTVHRQAERMAAIVDELLDLARIEARRGKDFLIERLDLGALVDEGIRDLSVPSGREAPQWTKPGEPCWVDVDRGKVLQSLGNVLGNAYKYSPDGGAVEVTLITGALDDEQPPRKAVGIQVLDHGIGLTPAQLARIGERFYRADTSGRIPGTGLGVSIVQEILQLLGGRLEFRSVHGQGSTVVLWLPLAEGGPQEP